MTLNAQLLNLLLQEFNENSSINISSVLVTMRSNLYYCCFYKQSFRICAESFWMLCAECSIAHFNSSFHNCCNCWIRRRLLYLLRTPYSLLHIINTYWSMYASNSKFFYLFKIVVVNLSSCFCSSLWVVLQLTSHHPFVVLYYFANFVDSLVKLLGDHFQWQLSCSPDVNNLLVLVLLIRIDVHVQFVISSFIYLGNLSLLGIICY